MKIIKIPLTIAASELLTAVDCSFSGTLMISKKKHWKICYCIVSQGCLYLYDDWLSRKAFLKLSLKEFECVWESTEEHHGEICCYLGYNDENPPLHFCCDTEKSQKEWVDELNRSILEVKFHARQSCDSGYGSAGIVHAIEVDFDKETRIGTDDKAYDEVDQRRFGNTEEASLTHMKEQHHALDSTDDDYEDVSCSLGGISAGCRQSSVDSSFFSVSAPSDPHCDMRSLNLAHENDSEIKTVHSHKSEIGKTETECHNGLSAGCRQNSVDSSFFSVSAPSDPHCDMRRLHLGHDNDSRMKTAHSDKSERSKTETERHNVRGLSARCRQNSVASSFCSVSAPSDTHSDMRSLHLAHENNSEIKAAHSEKSERSKTETERHNETLARQNRAIPHLKNVMDELKTKVQSDNKGLSGGEHKEDMQPT